MPPVKSTPIYCSQRSKRKEKAIGHGWVQGKGKDIAKEGNIIKKDFWQEKEGVSDKSSEARR